VVGGGDDAERGYPLFDIRLNRSGNSPSSAAGSGISAQIMVQPLSAPTPMMLPTISAIAAVRPN
jgi:hypothetical protein